MMDKSIPHIRDLRKIVENADFDYGHHDAAKLHTFDKEFSDKGRADVPTDGVYPRSDNAMANEIDEWAMPDDQDEVSYTAHPSQLMQVHSLLNKADVSDQEIKSGVELTDRGHHIVAGELGVGPKEVDELIGSLVQQLRSDDGAKESLAEEYRKFMAEAGYSTLPFALTDSADRYSYEKDALGNVTVRDGETGNSKFLRGAQATEMLDRLSTHAPDSVLGTLFEKAMNPETDTYDNEIAAKSGTYNFPWKLADRHGFGTVFFSEGDPITLRLENATDEHGDDVPLDDHLSEELLQQARDFIGQE